MFRWMMLDRMVLCWVMGADMGPYKTIASDAV
jgi:hypothetical protein